MSLNIDVDNGKEKKLSIDENTPLTYFVSRNVMQQEDLTHISGYDRHKPTIVESTKESFDEFKCTKFVKNVIPVLEWLPKYSIKNDFVGDLMAGITVAVMHIPQGMAYGILAGLTPSVGLYMAFFPTLVYFLFGTSRHISTGTFAVISIMTAKVVNTYATNSPHLEDEVAGMNITESLLETPDLPQYTAFQVATAVTMVSGIYQLMMSFLRLGTLASLLSKPLVNAFTTAAAIHVLVSQMKDLFGVTVPRYNGAFKIILTLIDIIKEIPRSNMPTVIVSVVVMLFMIFMNEFLKPKTANKCRFPIPAELMAVVGATLTSYLLGLGGPEYKVKLVGNIPLGLPSPEAPPLALLKVVAVDSIAITMVSFSIGISMALIFAQKQCYEVRPNQELFAFGLSNLVGSCFSCIPMACSLSRSVIQEQTGGKTQITSVVSASLILVLLLWLGPFFETLPKCVLAGIIIVALKSMFLQILDLPKFYRQSVLEAAVWIVTFLGVVLIDIDIGLLAGVFVSLAVLYIKGYKSYSCLLGVVPNTGIYVDIKTHKDAKELSRIKIFRYSGAINFACRSTFKSQLSEAIKVDHRVIRRASMMTNADESSKLVGIRAVILDLSTVPHIDFAACETFTEIKKELDLLSCVLLMTNPQDAVYDTLVHANVLGVGPFQVFPSIHDAVLFTQRRLESIPVGWNAV